MSDCAVTELLRLLSEYSRTRQEEEESVISLEALFSLEEHKRRVVVLSTERRVQGSL